VNLRPPYTTFDIVSESLSLATVVKVNDVEIAALAAEFGLPTEPPDFAAAVAAQFSTHTICVSLGAQGAGLWQGGRWIELHAPQVVVADTVGAGDAFFAGLVEGILQMRAPDAALSRAITLGSFLATRAGATPEYEAHHLGL
jgi:fructokinase